MFLDKIETKKIISTILLIQCSLVGVTFFDDTQLRVQMRALFCLTLFLVRRGGVHFDGRRFRGSGVSVGVVVLTFDAHESLHVGKTVVSCGR